MRNILPQRSVAAQEHLKNIPKEPPGKRWNAQTSTGLSRLSVGLGFAW
jgi:hypothetical protein